MKGDITFAAHTCSQSQQADYQVILPGCPATRIICVYSMSIKMQGSKTTHFGNSVPLLIAILVGKISHKLIILPLISES